MASTIILKRRISSIKGTRQITKAMQLVSASKLRKAQDYALRSQDYHRLAVDLMSRLSVVEGIENQPLFEKRNVKNSLYVVLTSNSGLAGAYNSNILRLLTGELEADKRKGVKSHVIAIGNKGAHYVRRIGSVDLLAFYPSFGDQPTANDLRPLLNTIVDSYRDKSVDSVKLLYTVYKNTLSQEAVSTSVLPAEKLENEGPQSKITNFEPDPESVVDEIATRLIEAELWQAVLEALASEHAMRMVAMKNATDNAGDLIDDYTLELNTVRQASITQELAEISGGVEALSS